MEQPGDDMRCVVLRAGQSVGPALRTEASQRGWSIISTDHELTAMTRLLLLDGVSRDRAAWGLETPRTTGLVIESPERWPNLRAMLLAVAKYLPDTQVWMVREQALQRLRLPMPSQTEDGAERRVDEGRNTSRTPGDASDRSEPARRPDRSTASGRAVLSGDQSGVVSQRPTGQDERTAQDEGEDSALISSEEINLLLRDPERETGLGTERDADEEEGRRRT